MAKEYLLTTWAEESVLSASELSGVLNDPAWHDMELHVETYRVRDKVHNFLTVADNGDICVNKQWLERADLTVHDHEHGVTLNSFENVIVVFYMTTQAGETHWTVVHSPIDSRQHVQTGTCALAAVEHQINAAIANLLSGWLPAYLPGETK